MRPASAILALGLVAARVACAAPADKTQTIPAPDAQRVATVASVKAESVVSIEDTRGQRLYARDFTSPDGEHGYVVERAAWSPNSRYFVFTLFSSGGHQSWRHKAVIYSVQSGRAFELDEHCVGVVAKPEFEFTGPDTLVVTTWETVPIVSGTTRRVTIVLSELPGRCDATTEKRP